MSCYFLIDLRFLVEKLFKTKTFKKDTHHSKTNISPALLGIKKIT